MAFILKDRVKESTTTTGTGNISLGGALATFDTFQTYLSNGDTTFYAIAHTSSGVDEWEVGLGTWNTGNTLTRTTVLAGSNSTSAVTFSAGTKDVFMTYPASKAIVSGEDAAFANITVTGTVDGRDIAADGTKLDGVEASADVTDTANVTSAGALMRSGGTMTGNLVLNANPSAALGAATKQYVDTEVSSLVNSAPSTLDTLNELAAALGDDANFSTTVTNSIATKLPLAGGTITGYLNIETAGGPSLTLKDTNGSGTAAALYIDFDDSAGSRVGYVGIGSGSTNDNWLYSTSGKPILGSGNNSAPQYYNGTSYNNIFHDGYHPNADTLTTARTINGVSFNGSANITIADSTKLPLAGGTMTGALNFSQSASNTGRKNVISALHTSNNTFEIQQFGFGHANAPRVNQIAASNAEQHIHIVTDASATVDAGTSTKGIFLRSGGNVGIGTQSPAGTLHLHSADTALRLTSSQGSNTPLAQLQYSSSGGYFLRMGDSANNEDVMIRTYGNSHFNGGNVLVGKTSSSATTQGIQLNADGRLWATATENDHIFNRRTSDGGVISVRKDGVEVGSISVGGGNAEYRSASALSLRPNSGTSATGNIIWGQGNFKPWNSSYFDLGDSTYKWKDLHLSGQANINSAAIGTASGNPTGSHDPGCFIADYGQINIHRDGGNPLRLGNSVDGNLTEYYRQGALVGTVSVSGGDNLKIGASTADHGGLEFATHIVAPLEAGSASDGTISLGASSARFSDLHLSGAVNAATGTYAGSGTASSPTLAIDVSSSSAFVHSQENLAANLASTQTNIIVIGKEGSTKNSGYLGFNWTSAGSNSNYVSLGHWGNNNLFRVYGDGTLKAGTNTIWHQGNDGSGSGLDADLLDGVHASNFIRKSGLGSASYYTADDWLEFNASTSKGLFWFMHQTLYAKVV